LPLIEPVTPPVAARVAEEMIPAPTVELSPEPVSMPRTLPVKRSADPAPEPPARDNGWLWIPAALLCCGMLVYAAQRIQRQDEELARTQKHLEEAKLSQEALRENEAARHRKMEADLASHQKRVAEMAEKLKVASSELKSASEKSVAREEELQTLIKFLRTEIEASEAQLQILKKALQVKSEIRKALP
jgi:hypothetical protein